MTKTFFSLPTKMAQPLFAGKIPRISTGTTSLFIPSVYGGADKRQAACVAGRGVGENRTTGSNFKAQIPTSKQVTRSQIPRAALTDAHLEFEVLEFGAHLRFEFWNLEFS